MWTGSGPKVDRKFGTKYQILHQNRLLNFPSLQIRTYKTVPGYWVNSIIYRKYIIYCIQCSCLFDENRLLIRTEEMFVYRKYFWYESLYMEPSIFLVWGNQYPHKGPYGFIHKPWGQMRGKVGSQMSILSYMYICVWKYM